MSAATSRPLPNRRCWRALRSAFGLWKDVKPFYSDAVYGAGKEIESRNAEAVLNAIILASNDSRQGHLRDVTRAAFDNAWALQSNSGLAAGAWVWQDFDYTPWESKESEYYWAAMMAKLWLARPDNYRDDPTIVGNLAALRVYLLRSYDGATAAQQDGACCGPRPSYPGLLTPAQRKTLIAEIVGRQHADGGWSLTDLGAWKRRDNTPLETRSDGYATGNRSGRLKQNTSPIRT